ncbi:hypothetical protein ACYSNW_10010 [Enterococcus sp. LJL99]
MIKKANLLVVASLVWMIAGFNVLKIGIETYHGFVQPINLLLSVVVFLIFWWLVFHKLTVKHTTRIMNYQAEKQLFIKFFDVKSFIIMAVMITGGLTIRVFNLLPNRFIAVFYSGLGAALFLAGVLFSYNYFKIKKIRSEK